METIHLIGSEDVRSAGSSMRVAASEMQSAANMIDNSLEMHRRFLEDWLTRFEEIMKTYFIVVKNQNDNN